MFIRTFALLGLATFLFWMTGCSVTPPSKTPKEAEIDMAEVRELFPLGDHHHRSAAITAPQAEEINRLLGYAAVKAEEVVRYVEVHPFPRHRGGLVDVLRESVPLDGGSISLFIAVRQGRIKAVAAEGNGIPGIQEFLDQFVGRTAGDTFEIATKPADLHTIPAKGLSLKDNLALSQKIAKTVKKALVVHEVMKL